MKERERVVKERERESSERERERESNVPKWTVQILSNIHSVRVSSVDKTEHVWSFTTKVRTAGLFVFLSSLFVGLLRFWSRTSKARCKTTWGQQGRGATLELKAGVLF